MTNLKDKMNDLAKVIEVELAHTYNTHMGFCLLIFPFHQPGISHYLANADRTDMIKALRETADRLERGEDNPR